MPLQIVRNDITKLNCDAIVNPSNSQLIPGGGTDAAIHRAAGPKLLEACRKVAPCPTGQARITPAFQLPCKYVIHTAGPYWRGGKENEEALLLSCYRECLELAVKQGCVSIAFPLISSGLYGYPKDKVLKLALSAIGEYLFDHELDVTLVVYDKESFSLGEKLFSGIEAYIDDNYVNRHRNLREDSCILREERLRPREAMAFACSSVDMMPPVTAAKGAKPDIDKYIKLDKPFAYKLWELIKARGMDKTHCRKRANVSKQTWYKIETDPHYKPSKKTVISFAVALKLSLEETQDLLMSVGFTLSKSSLFDVIIMYCLENGIYSVFEIDEILFSYDQETLFSKV